MILRRIVQFFRRLFCDHSKHGTLVDFRGLKELKDLLGGTMSIEQYRKTGGPLFIRTCLNCGKRLP